MTALKMLALKYAGLQDTTLSPERSVCLAWLVNVFARIRCLCSARHAASLNRQLLFRPFGTCSFPDRLPPAYAVVCILLPLRVWEVFSRQTVAEFWLFGS
jgi:hypothetical protein